MSDFEALDPTGLSAETETVDEVVKRLSKLSPLEYEQCRQDEAKRLNLRVSVLDSEVEANRPKPEVENAHDELVDGIKPCDYAVNGNDLAETIKNSLNKYLVLPSGADTAITLWIMASFTIDSFRIFPKLCLSSPEKRCGKTTTLEVIQAFANRPLLAANISASAIFRVIEGWKPTLLIDEADTFLNGKDELRGVINSGHTRSGAFVVRNMEIDGEWRPSKFSTWTPMVIAMIKKPPSTIIDRSVMIELQRKKPDEITERLPFDLIDKNQRFRSELMRWANDNQERVKIALPDTPKLPSDRAMDNWVPLLAVADLIGWGKTARNAMILLNAESEDDKAVETKLLEDIKEAFGEKERMFSKDLVKFLISDEDNIWCEWRHGKPMSANSLSRLLKAYKIHPKTIRIKASRKKGYELSQFKDAFERYLPSTYESNRDTVTTATDKALQGFQSVTQGNNVTDANPPKPASYKDCHGVTDEIPPVEVITTDAEARAIL